MGVKIRGGRELWSDSQLSSGGSIEDSPDRVVAYTEQEPEGIPFSEHAARGPVNRDFPQHQIGAWIIVKGRGDNRGQG